MNFFSDITDSSQKNEERPVSGLQERLEDGDALFRCQWYLHVGMFQ